MKKTSRLILLVLLLAALLRTWAVLSLPEDFDEPVYLRVAFDYANELRAGNVNGVLDYPESREHPALAKLLYSGVVFSLGEKAEWNIVFYLNRAVSALFGILAVVLVALGFGPLAGGMLAVHTLAVKYTSQVYLEALPHAASIAAVLAFLRVKVEKKSPWLWLSALALGITAAGKYTYVPVIVIVVLYLAVWEKNITWQNLLAYSVLALAAFWLFNVTLWHDPANRLMESLFFHARYSQGAHVQQSGYPWYQPFIWAATSAPARWHPAVFFYFGFDGLIFILAVAGLPREWKERRWLVVWLVAGMTILLLWPTRWPQYALTITPALCIAASTTATHLYRWIREQESYWGILVQMLPRPSKWFWVLAGAFLLFIAAIYLSAAATLIRGRSGWSYLSSENSLLPSNTVYDILPGADGEMILATGQGLTFWTPSTSSDLPDQWTTYNTSNSPLPSNRVLALARDTSGNLWFGTESGLSRFDGQHWATYRAADMGLANDQVQALAFGTDGRLYVGTLAGVSVWDGAAWRAIPELAGEHIFALAAIPSAYGNALWIGTSNGLLRFEARSGKQEYHLTEVAVIGLLIDSKGNLWAATSGNGLKVWDGQSWHAYNTGNSDLPFNTVNAVAEVQPGMIWAATAHPTRAGGALASFDGVDWHIYTPRNSGFSGAEPLVIVCDETGQFWIGTRTRGISIYRILEER